MNSEKLFKKVVRKKGALKVDKAEPTERSADSHFRSLPRGSLYVILAPVSNNSYPIMTPKDEAYDTSFVQRASLIICNPSIADGLGVDRGK